MPRFGDLDRLDLTQRWSYYESLRGFQESQRSTWDVTWKQLAAFIRPLRSRFTWSDANNGARRDASIINNVATIALRTLTSGMMNGMSSPSRPYFSFSGDAQSADVTNPEVARYHEVCADLVRQQMLDTNFYDALMELYAQEGQYGTGTMMIDEDERTVFRCRVYPIGSYSIGMDPTLRPDLIIRVISMTARQIAEEFGLDNVSPMVRTMVESNAGGVDETMFPVVHVIHKGSYHKHDPGTARWPWMSIWYEQTARHPEKVFLRISGYHEQPFCCGRWEVEGENAYGFAPGWDCLGDAMSLQTWEENSNEALEKMVKPPMAMSARAAVDPLRVASQPGDIMFVNAEDVRTAAAPLFQVNLPIQHAITAMQRIEKRINDAFFVDVFRMFSEIDGADKMTAEEVRARTAEKMQIIGPVVERNIEEVLMPAVIRIASIMQRRGLFPDPPQGLEVVKTRVRFESIIAQAARMSQLNNIANVVQFVSQQAALNPNAMDVLDMDAVNRRYAFDAALPLDLLASEDDIARARQQRAQQQQQQAMMENAQGMAQAAQTASQTPSPNNPGNTLLQDLGQAIGGAPS